VIEVRKASADSPEAVTLMRELSETLLSVTGRSGEASFRPEDMDAPRNVFAVAYLGGAPAGCGAIRELSPDICELKRMYARDKGQGVGRALLHFLEREAARLNYARIILETGTVNVGAVRFYLANGYTVIENFGKYVGRDDSVCFCKPSKF
jgi:GNAT superfamily N-acetyltransferase